MASHTHRSNLREQIGYLSPLDVHHYHQTNANAPGKTTSLDISIPSPDPVQSSLIDQAKLPMPKRRTSHPLALPNFPELQSSSSTPRRFLGLFWHASSNE